MIDDISLYIFRSISFKNATQFIFNIYPHFPPNIYLFKVSNRNS